MRVEPIITAPTGAPLRLSDLPAANTRRWVIRRKAEVVSAVRQGLLSFAEASTRYRLSCEEFALWERQIARHGRPGLRVTKAKEYR